MYLHCLNIIASHESLISLLFWIILFAWSNPQGTYKKGWLFLFIVILTIITVLSIQYS